VRRRPRARPNRLRQEHATRSSARLARIVSTDAPVRQSGRFAKNLGVGAQCWSIAAAVRIRAAGSAADRPGRRA
jgi:hypothetical protein